MHTHEKWLRDETWQRVVDNELEADELRELVAACEQHPELWKCCAVAFLEEQALRNEMKYLTAWQQQPESPLAPQAASPEGVTPLFDASARLSLSAGNALGSGQALQSQVTRATEQGPLARPANSSVLNSLAFAASVVLAFFVGWQASRRMAPDGAAAAGRVDSTVATFNASQSGNSSPSNSAPQLGGVRQRPQENFAPLQSSASEFDFVDVSSTPGSTADAIEQALERPDRFVALDSRIPKQLADLQQRGLVRIESTEGFVPVKLKDGKTAVVPVQQFDVRTIGITY